MPKNYTLIIWNKWLYNVLRGVIRKAGCRNTVTYMYNGQNNRENLTVCHVNDYDMTQT